MKKILILLSFLSVFGFADWITEQQFTSSCIAPKVRVEVPPPVIYNQGICSTGGIAALESYINTNTTSYFYNSGVYYYVERSVIYTLSNKACVDETHHKMTCQTNPCSSNERWDYELQKCTCIPFPNQRYNETLDECTDMCLPLDIYQGDGFMSLNILFPNDPIACKTPPIDSVPEDKCNQYSNQGYSYKCWTQDSSTMPLLTKLYYMIFPDEKLPDGKHCRCSSSAKIPPLILPTSATTKMPRISNDGIPPRLPDLSTTDPIIPQLEHPNMWTADDLITLFDDADAVSASGRQTEFAQLYDYLQSHPNDAVGNNFDYIDTQLVPNDSGGYTFEPIFDVTPTSTGTTPHFTDNTFYERINSNSVFDSVQNYAPRGANVASTADVYVTQWQTATKTKIEFVELADGTYELVSLRPTNISTTSTELIHVPATRTYYNVTDEGYTVVAYEAVNGSTTYFVSVSTNPNDNTETTAVSTVSNIGSNPNQYVYRTAYSYTTDLLTGSLSSSTSPSTVSVTSPNGTTYTSTNPTTNSTAYNYNTSNQNIDELLNFEPKVTDTGMTKPFNEMVKAQSETLDFIDSLKNSINGIKLDFDAMMLKLQNPPTLQPKSGNCVMTAVWHGNTITANPCTAFYPYREMISLFLTIVGMFFVGKFAVENLK